MDLGKMGMMVGGWIVSYVGNKLLDKVSQHLENRSAADMVEKVKAGLPHIQALIQAAERWRIEDPVLATWLRKLKDAAYEADDVLDELEFQDLHDRLFKKRKLSHFASSAVQFLQRFIMSDDELEKLKKLVRNFDEIYLDINCKEEQLKDYNAKQRSKSKETWSFFEGRPVGRDKEIDEILDLLLDLADEPESSTTCGTGTSSYPSLGVLPIVGIAGVGKTALAQHVYNHERVVRHFKLRNWVYVSDNFDVKRISKELVRGSGCQISDDTSLDSILRTLKNATTNTRFLFVLDDVWDETGSKWKVLRGALTSGAKGSMVLVTTRSPRVAEVMRTTAPKELNSLQEDDFWELFKRCAFGEKILEEERGKKLQTIGREISKKLHGLPLAGTVLGSLLESNLDVDFWKKILESEWWEHQYVLDNILPSLALSYEHLDSNLKQCFAYCSIFPRSYIFEKDRLIQMWMAQGFIQNKNRARKRIEDIGSDIFDELTGRYFFLPTLNNKYVMHDLIRVLAVHVSLDECLVLHDEKAEIPGTIRHLTLETYNMDAPMDLRNLHKFQKLRSILFFGDYYSGSFDSFLDLVLTQSKGLRVLDLSGSQLKNMKMLPNAFSELSHLRYLDVSCTTIEQLPRSFCQLCHLQFLSMDPDQILPEDMNKLINLRYLYGNVDKISQITAIGDLTNLQELKIFRNRKMERRGIGELKGLRNLRGRLEIMDLQNVRSKHAAMEAMLRDKEHLTELRFEMDSYSILKDDDMEGTLSEKEHITELGFEMDSYPILEISPRVQKEVFEGLQPHPNLKKLEIKNYGGFRFPIWMVENKFLTNLESISLESCPRLESIPPLGLLPFLKDLCIAKMPAVKRIGREFYGDHGVAFPSLEVLKFTDLSEWEEWVEADGTQFLPRLHGLHLHECSKLRKVPLFLSSSLAELRIEDCCDSGSVQPGCLQSLTSLTILEITSFHAQSSICLSNLRALKHLVLEDCPEIKLVGDLQYLTALEILRLRACPAQVSLSLSNLRALKHLHLENCPGVKLAGAFRDLTALEKLKLSYCPQLIDSSEPVQLHEGQGLRALNHLNIDGTILLQDPMILLGNLPSLQYLRIGGGFGFGSEILNFTEDLDMWFQQLTSLQELEIEGSPTLPLESLPASLVNLSTIRSLTIRSCLSISSLPGNGLSTSLKELHIDGCPLLKDRCHTGGADWQKIAHIPFICIDKKIIQKL